MMKRTRREIADELCVLACQDGDSRAFDRLVKRWQKPLWLHARRVTGRDDLAWDALQEAWLAIVRGLRRLSDPGRFEAWAHGIVRNKPVRMTKLSITVGADTTSIVMDYEAVMDLVVRLSANTGFRHRGETFLPEGNSLSGVPFLPSAKPANAELTATRVGDTELAQHVKAQIKNNPDWMPDWKPDDEF